MSSEITYTDTYIHFPDNTYLYEQDVLKSDMTGMIILWEGTVAPTGWAICDGTNGTPDLRGRFIVGLSTDASFNSVGNTGGEKKHTLTIAEMPSHSHTLPNDIMLYTGSTENGSNLQDNRNLNYGPNNTGATGGDGAHENLPPYYVLSYIMCKTPSYIQNLIITGTYDTYSAAGKTYYVFRGDGTIRFNFSAKQLSCILVGGGGGGGPIRITGLPYVAMGAGGGGGQVTSYSFIPNLTETYSITVGQGGQGAVCSVSATKNTTSFVSGISIAATQGGSTLLKNSANTIISSALGGSPGLTDGIAGTNYQSGGAAGIAQNCSTSAYFSDYGTIYTLGYNPTMYTSSTSGTNGIALSTGVIINGVTYTSLAGGGGGGNALEYRSFGTPAAVSGGMGGGGNGGSASYPINQTTTSFPDRTVTYYPRGIGINSLGNKLAYTQETVTTNQGLIYISNDGGTTWNPTSNPDVNNISKWSNSKIVISDDVNTLYSLKVSPTPAVVYKSTDGGSTWQSVFNTNLPKLICGSSDASKIFVATNPSGTIIYKSTGGGSFVSVYTRTNSQPLSMECGGDGQVIGYVSHTGTNSYYDFILSTDGGTTWSVKTIPPFSYHKILAISDNNNTILSSPHDGYSGYLYLSTDNATTWKTRLDDTDRYWTSGSLSYDGTIQAAGCYIISGSVYTGYIYLSIDNGNNWTSILTIPDATYINCSLSSDGTKLFWSNNGTVKKVGIINITIGTLGISGTSGTPNTGGGGGGAGQFENYMLNTLSYTAGMATSFTYNVNSYAGGSGVCVLSFDT